VVETRAISSIANAVRCGRHLAGWSVVEGFSAHILAGIWAISEGIQGLPIGTAVGVWALGDDRFRLFNRSPSSGTSLVDVIFAARHPGRLPWVPSLFGIG
jgi:hypothetical protein